MAKWPYGTAAWKKLRKLKLAHEPLCEDCQAQGRLTFANTVDHRHAISQGGNPFPPLDQLASMCASCHSMKTARGPEAGAVKAGIKGCNPDGTPIDPRHPWSAHHSDQEKSLRAAEEGPLLVPSKIVS